MSKIGPMWLKTFFYVVGPTIVFLGVAVNTVVVIAAGLATVLVSGVLLHEPQPDHTTDDER